MNQYAIYLRKSRADLDAEARGEGETLSKHRTALRALAQKRGLFVLREYAEIVTGDSIAARPQMQELLADVKKGLYAGVIVNDIDRLGRGDSIDQEIIKLTLAAARCIIITPNRDIDPANQSDQDMLDFSLFFARFEYRKISQRLHQGCVRSASQGAHVNIPPYGYRRGPRASLEPDPETAPILRMIFQMVDEGHSMAAVAKHLNGAGIKTARGNMWTSNTVRALLANPAYIGDVVYGKTRHIKTIDENGVRKAKNVPSDSPIIVHNAHAPLVDTALFDRVQRRSRRSSANVNRSICNPFTGIAFCSHCGRSLKRFTGRGGAEYIGCVTPGCHSASMTMAQFTTAVFEALNGWCAAYDGSAVPEPPKPDMELAATLKKQLATICKQMTRAQELVETDVYTVPQYLARKAELEQQQRDLESRIDAAEHPVRQASIADIIPTVKSVLEAYDFTPSMGEKNALLREVIARIDYSKTKKTRGAFDAPALVNIDVMPQLNQRA